MRLRRSTSITALFAGALLALLLALPPAASAAGILTGRVISGGRPLNGYRVTLRQQAAGESGPSAVLGSALTGQSGVFRIRYDSRAVAPGAVRFLIAARASGAGALTLASALGPGPVPARVAANDLTTVAMAYAMAQFIHGHSVQGESPGLQNAADMSGDLVDVETGQVAPVLRRAPNGPATTTLATVNSLANLLGDCRAPGPLCSGLLRLSAAPGSRPATDTLQAAEQIARSPWRNVARLYALALHSPPVYRPALGSSRSVDAWTIALRFEGDGRSINGPGNFAIDAGGNIWATNNYEYSRERLTPVCASKLLLRFTPTGAFYPLSPYTGGGLSGAGFGIAVDPQGNAWVANFGFAAPECPAQPPHNSVSEFTSTGGAISPPATESFGGGFTQGGIDWPQGTISDAHGDIWIANCANNSVTRYAGGNPESWSAFTGIGLQKPFDLAFNGSGDAFVTGNGNSKVAILGPDGEPLPGSPISGGGLARPLGIAADSKGNMWVANSGKLVLPCTGETTPSRESGGTVTLIKANGELANGGRPFEASGLTVPWGVAVDGDDDVWVANFGGQRVTELCGTSPALCPAGKRRTGQQISPAGSGYGFDGLVRNTGVAIDPSGNVWLANNWKTVPIQSNPGGYQVVAFIGLAAPIRAPLIGPPERP